MKKLKNCYYKKVKEPEIYEGTGQRHYFAVYDKNKKLVDIVIGWDTVLTYNKHGVIKKSANFI